MSRVSTRRAAVLGGLLLALTMFAFEASHAQAPANGTVVLTGGRVIDGTGRPPLEQATIVITNGRVDAIGPPATVKIPAGTTPINVTGKTIVPGFINAHGHLGAGDKKLPLREQIIQQLRLYAQYGVTTVQSLGDDGIESVNVHDEQEREPLDRARLYTAGAAVVGESVDDARQKVDKVAAMRVDMIKTRMNRLTFADGSRTGPPYQRIHTTMDWSPTSHVVASAAISNPTMPRRSLHGAPLKASHHAATAAPPARPPRTRTRNSVAAPTPTCGAPNRDSHTTATMATPGQIRSGLALMP